MTKQPDVPCIKMQRRIERRKKQVLYFVGKDPDGSSRAVYNESAPPNALGSVCPVFIQVRFIGFEMVQHSLR